MGDQNAHSARFQKLQHDHARDEAASKLLHEKRAAEAQAFYAMAYREMPADLRQQAAAWGVSALMEAVWMNAWECGYRQSVRDSRAALEGGKSNG